MEYIIIRELNNKSLEILLTDNYTEAIECYRIGMNQEHDEFIHRILMIIILEDCLDNIHEVLKKYAIQDNYGYTSNNILYFDDWYRVPIKDSSFILSFLFSKMNHS